MTILYTVQKIGGFKASDFFCPKNAGFLMLCYFVIRKYLCGGNN